MPDYKFHAVITYPSGAKLTRTFRIKNAPSLDAANERLAAYIRREFAGFSEFSTWPDENWIPIDNTSNDVLEKLRGMFGMK